MEAAARLGDLVGHDWGMAGMIGGALLGAAVAGALVAATVVTGGAAAVAVAGLVAGGALAGGQLAKGLQTVMGAQNPTTGTLAGGSPDVRVNGRPAMRAKLDFAASCSGLFSTHHLPKPQARIAEGSGTVRVNGQPQARVADRLECAATITEGSPDVFVGGPPEQVLAVVDNQATWTKVAAVVGLVALGGGAVVAALAGTTALVGFAAVGAAGYGLNEGLGWVGDRLGPGWRDVLQGGAGVVGIVAGAPRGARALQRQQTAQRVRANVAASQRARAASGFGGRTPAAGSRASLTATQQARAQRKLAESQARRTRHAHGPLGSRPGRGTPWELNHQATSGARLRTTPGQTTTVLGNFQADMKPIVAELGNVKTTYAGPRRNGFNVLNVPDAYYRSPDQFWREYNEPWLRQAVQRGDPIIMATRPTFEPNVNTGTSLLMRVDPNTGMRSLSGFGREYLFLRRNGYVFDPSTQRMTPRP